MAQERTRDRSTTPDRTPTIKVAKTPGTATGITRVDPTMTDTASDESTTINLADTTVTTNEGTITIKMRRSRDTRVATKPFQYPEPKKIARVLDAVCPSALPRKDRELVSHGFYNNRI